MNNSKTRIESVDTGMSLRAQRLAALKATGKVPQSNSQRRNDAAVMIVDDEAGVGSSSKKKKKKSLFMRDEQAGGIVLDGDAEIVEEKFLQPKGAKSFRVNGEMREKFCVYNPILDKF